MMKKLLAHALLAISLASMAAAAPETPMSFYSFNVKTLEDQPQPLSAFEGKVTLVVNLASKCGFTKQYTALQKLYTDYKDKGLVVIGFPANDFGGQEPGTAEEIRTFCSTKYSVTFPIMEKVKTKGEGQSPVYAFLSAGHGEPKWNFHKYLVGKDGKVIAAFPSKVAPDSKELTDAIDAALAK